MTIILPEHINRMRLRVHGASGVLMMAPRTEDEFGDREAEQLLRSAVIHRGAHGIRVRSLICVDQALQSSFRILFPIPAPDFLHGAGTLLLESISFEYQMLSSVDGSVNGSVSQVVAWDERATLAAFSDFSHNGGEVQLTLDEVTRFRKALSIGLILRTPVGRPVGLDVSYLSVRLATSTSITPDPDDIDVFAG